MKKKFTTLAILILGFLSIKSQTPLPYMTGFDNASECLGWNYYENMVTPFTEWEYEGAMAYSTPSCLVHYYPVGGSQETIDWAVSPVFNFSGGGKIDSVRARFGGFLTPGTMDTVAIYLLTGSSNPALATSRKLLFDFRGANYQNDNVWRKFTNITIPPTAGQSYIAFYYRTVVSWLDVRFDNLRLSSSVSAPAATFTASSANACKNQAITFTDLSTNIPASWSWQFPGGTPATSTASNPAVTYAAAGIYTVTLISTNAGGASAPASKTVSINSCTSVNEIATGVLSALVYPNPGSGMFTLEHAYSDANVTITNLLGEEILNVRSVEETKMIIDLQSQPKGIYLLRLETTSGVKTMRLIKD